MSSLGGPTLKIISSFQVQILSTGTEFEIPFNTAWNKLRLYDELSDSCFGANYHSDNSSFINMAEQKGCSQKPACCCDNTACNIGTFESILYVMKESMSVPHVLDVDWSLQNFDGNLTAGFLKIPLYVTENVTGFPLVYSRKAPTVKDLKRFMNLEPFIPLCEFINGWFNEIPHWEHCHIHFFIKPLSAHSSNQVSFICESHYILI